MKHGVGEKCVERDVLPLRLIHQDFRNWLQYFFELGLHRVLELQSTGTFRQLHLLIVRQVNGYRFRAGVAVPGVVHDVVRVQVGISSRRFRLVRIGNRQATLQLRKKLGKACKTFAPFRVL